MALLQSPKNNGGGYVNVRTLTFASVTAGSTLLIGLTAGSADTIASWVDDKGNTWTLVDTETDERQTWVYKAYNVASGTTVVTITFGSGQYADSTATGAEESGVTTTDPQDVTISGNDGGGYVQTHYTATSATTTQANEVVYAFYGSAGGTNPGLSAGSGYSDLSYQAGSDPYTHGGMERKEVTSTGTQIATFVTTEYVRAQVILITLKKAGGSTTNKTLSATVTIVPVLLKVQTARRTLSAVMTGVATILKPRKVIKTLSGVMTAVPVLSRIRSAFRTLSAVMTGSPTLSKVRTVIKTLSASMTAVATLTKRVGKTLLATMTGVATLSASKAFGKTLTAVMTAVATIGKSFAYTKTLSAVMSASATLSKLTVRYRTLSATVIIVPIVSKFSSFYRTLSATVTAVASLSASKVFLRTLTATVTGVVSISRRIGKVLLATLIALPNLTRQVSKYVTLSYMVVAIPTLNKITARLRTLSASVTVVATITRTKMYMKTLSGTVTGIASLTRQVSRQVTLSASVIVSASVQQFRQFKKVLSATVTGVANLVALALATFLKRPSIVLKSVYPVMVKIKSNIKEIILKLPLRNFILRNPKSSTLKKDQRANNIIRRDDL